MGRRSNAATQLLVNYFFRAKKREYYINLKLSLAIAHRSSEQPGGDW